MLTKPPSSSSILWEHGDWPSSWMPTSHSSQLLLKHRHRQVFTIQICPGPAISIHPLLPSLCHSPTKHSHFFWHAMGKRLLFFASIVGFGNTHRHTLIRDNSNFATSYDCTKDQCCQMSKLTTTPPWLPWWRKLLSNFPIIHSHVSVGDGGFIWFKSLGLATWAFVVMVG